MIAPAACVDVCTRGMRGHRYKKSLLTDVIVQNKRRKFDAFSRARIPTHKSVDRATARMKAGQPDTTSPERAARLRQKRQERREQAQQRKEAALAAATKAEVAATAHERRRQRAKRRALRRAPGGRAGNRTMLAAAMGKSGVHTNLAATHTNGGVGVTKPGDTHHVRWSKDTGDAGVGGNRRARAARRGTARSPTGRHASQHTTTTASARRRKPPRKASHRSEPSAVPLVAPPQWHVPHSGGISYAAQWQSLHPDGPLSSASEPTLTLPAAANHGQGSTTSGQRSRSKRSGKGRGLGRSRTTGQLASETGLPALAVDVGGRRQRRRSRSSVGRTGGKRSTSPGKRYAPTPVSPRAALPPSNDTSLPAMAKAHLQGYLEEGVAVSHRWGCLRVRAPRCCAGSASSCAGSGVWGCTGVCTPRGPCAWQLPSHRAPAVRCRRPLHRCRR